AAEASPLRRRRHPESSMPSSAATAGSQPDTDNPQSAIPNPQSPIPVLPVRESVVFPRLIIPLQVGRERSVRAVESAVAGDKRILLVTQIERERDEVGPDDLYRIGTLAEIIRVRNTNEGTLHVVIRGLARVHIIDFDQAEPFFRAGYATLEESVDEGV